MRYDLIDGDLVTLFKGIGSKSLSDCYRGITFLGSFGKALVKILLNRLLKTSNL